MRCFSSSKTVLATAAAGLFITMGGAAQAQTTPTILLPLAGSQIPRTPLPSRDITLKPNWINRADCLANEQLTFSLTLQNYLNNGNLDAWVGASSCSDPSTRTGTDPTCWLVYHQQPSANLTNNTYNVVISARDIVGRQIQAQGGEPNAPLTAPISVCDADDNANQQLVVDFMFVEGTNVQGSVAEWPDMGYDITPPSPPTGLVAGVGDTRLHLGWTTSPSGDIYQYNFYCQSSVSSLGPRYFDASTSSIGQLLEAGTSAGGARTDAGDASAGGSSVVGAGGSSGTTTVTPPDGSFASVDGSVGDGGPVSVCAPTVLIPGSDPVSNNLGQYQCGSVNGLNATAGTASGLTDNLLYVVTVSGVDTLQNIGPLSETVCATPVQLTDFFNFYRQQGGRGGGGFCSVSRARRSPAAPAALIALSALWFVVRRRRGS